MQRHKCLTVCRGTVCHCSACGAVYVPRARVSSRVAALLSILSWYDPYPILPIPYQGLQ